MTRWSTNAEVELLKRYASQAQYGIVEIGVFDGETTKEMLQVAKVTVYAIDPLVPDSMEPFSVGSEKSILLNLKPFSNAFFIKDYSYNVAMNFMHKFDFIWIDGDHTYRAVKQDFQDWFPMLQVGGYVAFHDSAPVTSIQPSPFSGWEGPTTLVTELIKDPRLQLVEVVDTISVFKKLWSL